MIGSRQLSASGTRKRENPQKGEHTWQSEQSQRIQPGKVV